jgi:heme O synthase-like polyprenyltransferase
MLKYAEDYHRAGFPVMTDIFTPFQFRNIILAWMIGATAMSFLLVLSGFWILLISKVLIMILNLVVIILFTYQFYFARNPFYKLMFITMNSFLIVVLSMIILERFHF